MTAAFGQYFIIAILAMIPFVFIGAGKDTTLRRAEQKQHQAEALLSWTDKDALENGRPEPVKQKEHIVLHTVKIEKLNRSTTTKIAA